MPLTYWTYAFATTVYLINRKPTPTLHLSSPYEQLFGSPPNYTKLHVFGSLCYPWLRPYTTHKLDSRSVPYVFLGYSLTQSAYLCLDPSTLKIYISRHVKFVETSFPFTSHQAQLSHPRIKILVNTDISVIGFYGNIGNIGKISVDIFTKISVRLKFFIF